MKKLFSFAALCALLYVMPMSANLISPSIFYYLPAEANHTIWFIFIMLVSINIQALLFQYLLKNIAYFEGIFLAMSSHAACYWFFNISTFYNDLFNAILPPLENLIARFSGNLWIALAVETLILAIINSVLMIIGIALAKLVNGLYRKSFFEFPSIGETWMPIVLGNIIVYASLFILKMILEIL